MQNLSRFFEKYRHLEPPVGSVRKSLIAILHEECGILLDENEILIQNGGARLRCHPAVLSELTLCAPRVLEKLRERHNVRLAFLR